MENYIIIGTFGILLLIGMPMAFALGVTCLSFILFHTDLPLMIINQRMAESLNNFTIMALPLYIFVAKLMNSGGITNRVFAFAKASVGSIPGGLAHVNIFGSIMFAGMSGAALADVAGLGTVEIKAMRDAGYDPEFSAAVTAASSTVGPIIPPSLVMVVYGALGEVSIGRLFVGGVIPGLLMGLSLSVAVYMISLRKKYPISKRPNFSLFLALFLKALAPLMTIVIIIGGILGGIFTPTEAAGVAVIYALVLTMVFYREIGFIALWRILLDTAKDSSMILFIISTASMFGWIIAYIQFPQTFTDIIFSITSNKYLILLFLNILLIVLGCFMDTLAMLTILTPLLVPMIIKVGIDPVHFGVVMVVNLLIGGLTPPVAMLSFIVSNVADIPFDRVVRATIPFIIPLAIILVLITYFPQFVLFLPNLLFD